MGRYEGVAAFVQWLGEHAHATAVLTAVALAATAVLVRNFGSGRSERQRRTAMVILLLLSTLILAVTGALLLVGMRRWGYLLAILPGAIIARHAVYMRLIRRQALAAPVARPRGLERSDAPTKVGGDNSDTLEDDRLLRVFARARQVHDLDFSPDTLAIRFGVPALISTLIGIGVFEALGLLKDRALVSEATLRAAWFGAAGALVYVLLYLGQRSFRSDITSGAAIWSSIVMALGPVFGAILALIWKGTGTAQGGGWTYDAIYFVAGMSPRHAASVVEEAVRRLWLVRSGVAVQPRLQPLSQLRGMTPAIEDRLAEEGIGDVQGMAMADPLKLLRSTSFDKRQILSWMDEAMFMLWLPTYWTTLQKVGITGAVDLMAHVMSTGRKERLGRVLAGSAKLDTADIEAITLVGELLHEDAQLRLIWALYQFDEEDGLQVDGQPAATSTSSSPKDTARGRTQAHPPASGQAPEAAWLIACAILIVAAIILDGQRITLSSILVPASLLGLGFGLTTAIRDPRTTPRTRRILITGSAGLALVMLILSLINGDSAPWLARTLAHDWSARALAIGAAALCMGIHVAKSLAAPPPAKQEPQAAPDTNGARMPVEISVAGAALVKPPSGVSSPPAPPFPPSPDHAPKPDKQDKP